MADLVGAPAANPQVMFNRERFRQELEANPWLKNKVLAISAGENVDPVGNLSVMETMFNRADMMGTPLAQETRLHPSERGYYAGYNPRALGNPRLRSMIESNLEKALSGSNASNFATEACSSVVDSSAKMPQE